MNDLLQDILAGRYGTKNRSELIQRVEAITQAQREKDAEIVEKMVWSLEGLGGYPAHFMTQRAVMMTHNDDIEIAKNKILHQ